MAVSEDDVRHIANLARLGLEPDRVVLLAQELNGILTHMEALAAADTSSVNAESGGERAMPLREDGAAPTPLSRSRDSFAPAMTDGFFLVPRLSTHEDSEEGA